MRFHVGISFRPKQIIKWLIFVLFGLLAFFGVGRFQEAKASVIVDYDSSGQYVQVSQSPYIDYNNPLDTHIGPTQANLTDVWFKSLSQFIYVGYAKGEYLNVDADYYVSIFAANGNSLTNYIYDESRNNLKQEYLRCGIGSTYKSGYSETAGLPEISNFRVTLSANTSGGNNMYIYHVKYSYRQRIPSVNANDLSITCYFQPQSNKLFAQHLTGLPSGRTNLLRFGYQNNILAYSITTDPVIGQLSNIQTGINDINNNLNNGFSIINNTLNNGLNSLNDTSQDIYDDLTDDSDPDSDISSLGSVSSIIPSGPVDSLLTIPVTFLNKTITALGGTCSPFTFTFVFGEEMTFPCFEDLYDEFPAALRIFVDTIPSAFLLILYFKHLYKKVDRATSLEADSSDDWGVI